MSTDHTPVDGPYPITVEQIPTGVTLDIEAFVTALVVDLAQGALAADFLDIVEMYETAAPHDGHARELLLVEELVERLATRIPVYGLQYLTLAGRIRAAAEPIVRTDQQRGAA